MRGGLNPLGRNATRQNTAAARFTRGQLHSRQYCQNYYANKSRFAQNPIVTLLAHCPLIWFTFSSCFIFIYSCERRRRVDSNAADLVCERVFKSANANGYRLSDALRVRVSVNGDLIAVIVSTCRSPKREADLNSHRAISCFGSGLALLLLFLLQLVDEFFSRKNYFSRFGLIRSCCTLIENNLRSRKATLTSKK